MELHRNLKPWPSGVSGNPNGRPVGSRSAFSAGFTRDLAEVWAEKGKASMLYTPEKQPATFFGLAISCACLRATKRGVSPSTWPRCRGCCGRRGRPCAAPIGRGRPAKGALALTFDERIQKHLANVL